MGRKAPTPKGLTGRRLARLIRRTKLSYEQLAAAAGVYPSTIYRLVDGRTDNPQPRTKRALARALGVPPHRLFAGDERQLPLAVRETPLPTEIVKEVLTSEFNAFAARFPSSCLLGARTAIETMHRTLLGFADKSVMSEYTEYVDSRRDSLPAGAEQLCLALEGAIDRLPSQANRLAAREAVSEVLNLRLILGEDPTPELYDRITFLRLPAGRISTLISGAA